MALKRFYGIQKDLTGLFGNDGQCCDHYIQNCMASVAVALDTNLCCRNETAEGTNPPISEHNMSVSGVMLLAASLDLPIGIKWGKHTFPDLFQIRRVAGNDPCFDLQLDAHTEDMLRPARSNEDLSKSDNFLTMYVAKHSKQARCAETRRQMVDAFVAEAKRLSPGDANFQDCARRIAATAFDRRSTDGRIPYIGLRPIPTYVLTGKVCHFGERWMGKEMLRLPIFEHLQLLLDADSLRKAIHDRNNRTAIVEYTCCEVPAIARQLLARDGELRVHFLRTWESLFEPQRNRWYYTGSLAAGATVRMRWNARKTGHGELLALKLGHRGLWNPLQPALTRLGTKLLETKKTRASTRKKRQVAEEDVMEMINCIDNHKNDGATTLTWERSGILLLSWYLQFKFGGQWIHLSLSVRTDPFLDQREQQLVSMEHLPAPLTDIVAKYLGCTSTADRKRRRDDFPMTPTKRFQVAY